MSKSYRELFDSLDRQLKERRARHGEAVNEIKNLIAFADDELDELKEKVRSERNRKRFKIGLYSYIAGIVTAVTLYLLW